MMTQPSLHLFVCQNDRPEGGRPSCGARGSAAVLAALQILSARNPRLYARVRQEIEARTINTVAI